jgi:DNA (cytosine-5)-methyltransferase 1
MRKPTHIDLFSGIGGFALAANAAGFRTIAFCEKETFCQKVLKKNWQAVPIIGDISEFDGRNFRGADLLTGGFPCQPFSVAGKRKGKTDDRYLWPEMFRVIKESESAWIVGENVDGLDGLGLDDSISDLESIGYEVAPPLEIPACATNAPHERNRIWIIAHLDLKRRLGGGQCDGSHAQSEQCSKGERQSRPTSNAGRNEAASNSDCERESQLQGCVTNEWGRTSNSAEKITPDSACDDREARCLLEARRVGRDQIESGGCSGGGIDFPWTPTSQWFECEPALGRMVHGISNRTHRIKALGNAIVPQVAFQIISEIYRQIKTYEQTD